MSGDLQGEMARTQELEQNTKQPNNRCCLDRDADLHGQHQQMVLWHRPTPRSLVYQKGNFMFYHEHVYRPYIESKRNLPVGVPISDEQRAVGYRDGGGPQLKAIQNEDSMQKDDDSKITNNKHSASRSAVEQFMDLMRIFMIMKRLCQIITAISRPILGFIEQTRTFGQTFEEGFLTNCNFFALSDSIGTTLPA